MTMHCLNGFIKMVVFIVRDEVKLCDNRINPAVSPDGAAVHEIYPTLTSKLFLKH